MSSLNAGTPQERRPPDERRYCRIVQRLEEFDVGDLPLSELLVDLGKLVEDLECKPDRGWVDAYSALCSELSTVDAVASYRSETAWRRKHALADEELQRARDIAGALKRLVTSGSARLQPGTAPSAGSGRMRRLHRSAV